MSDEDNGNTDRDRRKDWTPIVVALIATLGTITAAVITAVVGPTVLELVKRASFTRAPTPAVVVYRQVLPTLTRTSTPTQIPLPTFTPTFTPTDTPLPTLTNTPTPTPTQTPQPQCTVNVNGALNLREGPGVLYNVISQMTNGTSFEGVERTPDGTWIYGISPTARGWASATYLTCTYDLLQLPAANTLPPTYTPMPTDTPTPTSTSTHTPTPAPQPPPTAIPAPANPPTQLPNPTLPPSPTATPIPPFVRIIAPQDTVSCINPEVWCQFEIRGTAGGDISFKDLRIYTFVFPVQPPGAGWYLQKPPASIEPNRDWIQSSAYLGDGDHPVETNNTLRIRAALVQKDATFNGTKLSDLKGGTALAAVEDIDGIVVLSNVVFLVVHR
jgi:hypothetical protein